jgi:hypothetical protein
LKKSVRQNSLAIDWLKRLFCTLLREIRVRKPLPKVKISISDAYFSDAETMVDFFNKIGRSLPVAAGSYGQFTANHGYEACWSDRMQTGGQVECSIPIGIPTKN